MNLLRRTMAGVFALTMAVGCVAYTGVENGNGICTDTVSALEYEDYTYTVKEGAVTITGYNIQLLQSLKYHLL